MLDVIIGRHTWNCQIRTHIHTGYTHTRTHAKKEKDKVERFEKKMGKTKNKKKYGGSGKKKLYSQRREKKERTKRNGEERRRKMREKGGTKNREEKKRKRQGDGFRGVEEREYRGGQDLILITLDRHECFSVFHHL